MSSRGARGDPDLLQGEDPFTEDPRDARTWIAVYDELVALKLRLLGRVDRRLAGAPPDAGASARHDVAMLRDQLERYRHRLEFWHRRHAMLAGIVVDRLNRLICHHGVTVQLTPREFQLLQALLEHPSRHLTPRQLVVNAWQDPALSDEELRIYIASLRRKLASLGLGRIANRRSHGYALMLGEDAAVPAAAS